MSEGAAKSFWSRHKVAAVIGGAALIALVLPAAMQPICSITDDPGNAVAYRITEQSEGGISTPEPEEKPPISQFSFGPSIDATKQTITRTQTGYYPTPKKEKWIKGFVCDVNGADYVLAWFTIFLAISTFYLWRETENLAKGAADQSEKMVLSIAASNRIADETRDIGHAQTRAYLGCLGAAFSIEERWVRIVPTIKNFGQSPALNIKLTSVLECGLAGIYDEDVSPKFVTLFPSLSMNDQATTMLLWGKDGLSKRLHSLVYEKNHPIGATMLMEWQDVFGAAHSATVDLIELKHLLSPNPRTAGDMVASTYYQFGGD